MTLQQLKYYIAIVEHGSINAAARNLYSSQSNLSTAIKDLEEEFGLTFFERSNRGISLTNDGTEFLAYARQIIEQSDLIHQHFTKDKQTPLRLAVSSQHYAFCVQAFIKTIEEFKDNAYEFILRETRTYEIIDTVSNFSSDIGVLYLDEDNKKVLERSFNDAQLSFKTLFLAQPHVFVGINHPLAKKKKLKPKDLADYPRYSFEQGTDSSLYFSEEPLSKLPTKQKIIMSDRGTLTDLLTDYNGYTISTGVRSTEMLSNIVPIPLEVDIKMVVGYLIHQDRTPSGLSLSYIENLKKIIKENATVHEYVGDKVL